MKHYDDDGDLTFFAKEDRGLIACSKGHYWTFSVKRHEAPTADREHSDSLDAPVPESLRGFGPEVLEALTPPG